MREHMLPHNLDAEQAVLAAMMVDQEAAARVADLLTAGSFYRGAHAVIFSGLVTLFRRNDPTDLIALQNLLTERGQLEDVGGYGYLVDLASSIPTTAHADHYAAIVAEKARRRALIKALQDSLSDAFDEAGEDDPIGEAQKRLIALDLGKQGQTGWRSLGSLESENYERMEVAYQAMHGNRAPINVLELGFYDLDSMVSLEPGDMAVLAARTGYGKTSLAMCFARNVAERGHLVGVFSLEMSGHALARRSVASVTGIHTHRQRTGFLAEHDWSAASAQIERDRDLPLFISDKPTITVTGMLAQCRKLMAIERKAMGLVVVDYLTLADVDGKVGSETERASKISRALKLMAMELGCPVIALAQLNRQVDNRPGQKPELRDLKQSGSIEQDASVVIFIHRDGHQDGQKLTNGPVKLIVAKNRNGESGEVNLYFDASRTLFTSIASAYQEGSP